MSSRDPSAGPGTIVRCCDYSFCKDTAFFVQAVDFARKYADKEPPVRPPEDAFETELQRLRRICPLEASALLDQVVHRWQHPDCPDALYVLTCTLRAPEGRALLDDRGRRRREVRCTKVGKAKRTVVARIERYCWDVLGGVPIVPGSQQLRAVAYGPDSTTLKEAELKRIAHAHGQLVQMIETTDPKRIGPETFLGVAAADAICAALRQLESRTRST